MEISLMKERFLHFIIALTVCTLLGYLSNDTHWDIHWNWVRYREYTCKKTREKETRSRKRTLKSIANEISQNKTK